MVGRKLVDQSSGCLGIEEREIFQGTMGKNCMDMNPNMSVMRYIERSTFNWGTMGL